VCRVDISILSHVDKTHTRMRSESPSFIESILTFDIFKQKLNITLLFLVQ